VASAETASKNLEIVNSTKNNIDIKGGERCQKMMKQKRAQPPLLAQARQTKTGGRTSYG
jgi:hypothetical protein